VTILIRDQFLFSFCLRRIEFTEMAWELAVVYASGTALAGAACTHYTITNGG
jgi:hypothetical protein